MKERNLWKARCRVPSSSSFCILCCLHLCVCIVLFVFLRFPCVVWISFLLTFFQVFFILCLCICFMFLHVVLHLFCLCMRFFFLLHCFFLTLFFFELWILHLACYVFVCFACLCFSFMFCMDVCVFWVTRERREEGERGFIMLVSAFCVFCRLCCMFWVCPCLFSVQKFFIVFLLSFQIFFIFQSVSNYFISCVFLWLYLFFMFCSALFVFSKKKEFPTIATSKLKSFVEKPLKCVWLFSLVVGASFLLLLYVVLLSSPSCFEVLVILPLLFACSFSGCGAVFPLLLWAGVAVNLSPWGWCCRSLLRLGGAAFLSFKTMGREGGGRVWTKSLNWMNCSSNLLIFLKEEHHQCRREPRSWTRAAVHRLHPHDFFTSPMDVGTNKAVNPASDTKQK